MRKQTWLYVLGTLLVLAIAYAYMFRDKPNTLVDQPSTEASMPERQDDTATLEIKDNPEFAQNEKLLDTYSKEITAGNLKDGDSYYQRGLVYLKMRQLRAAINDFSAALRMVPDSANALYSRALAYQQERQFEQALADLNAAIKYKPDFAAAYNLRGLINVEQDNLQDAQADYKNAIKIDPDFDQAYFNLGTLYARQKQYPEAKQAFLTAINVNKPTDAATETDRTVAKSRLSVAYLNLANVEFTMDDLTSALKTASYVIENDPTNVEAYRLRAEIYERKGDTAAAVSDRATADNFSLQNILNTR